MRAWMISFTIIIFCFSINILNQVSTEHFAETNTTIWGWTSPEYMNYTDSWFSGLQDDSMEATLGSNFDFLPQPLGLALETAWAAIMWVVKGISFLINTLIMATIGFPSFITDFNTGTTIIPTYIAYPISVMVYACYVIALFQFATGRSLGRGI